MYTAEKSYKCTQKNSKKNILSTGPRLPKLSNDQMTRVLGPVVQKYH